MPKISLSNAHKKVLAHRDTAPQSIHPQSSAGDT
jgi:hypothetical protein